MLAAIATYYYPLFTVKCEESLAGYSSPGMPAIRLNQQFLFMEKQNVSGAFVFFLGQKGLGGSKTSRGEPTQ